MFENHLSWITGNYPKYIRNSYNSVAKNPNNLVFKWAKDQNGKILFFIYFYNKRRPTNSQQVCVRVFNTTKQQRNANQNHHMSPHTC